MRLWTIHPSYLDTKGLSGLWREGLLAKKVLNGLTKGYKNHPQLNRFYNHENTNKAINCYLYFILQESKLRGYSFDSSKIIPIELKDIQPILVNNGQVNYEFNHLMNKLNNRSPEWFNKIDKTKKIKIHPIFKTQNGEVESWEKV